MGWVLKGWGAVSHEGGGVCHLGVGWVMWGGVGHAGVGWDG